jgi:Nitrile hydratase, alpha chain
MAEEQAMTRQEIETKLVAQAWQDDSFKEELINNPKSAFEQEGIPLPESIEIRVVEESANCLYFVLPMKPSGTEELSEADLESVAGGGWLKVFEVNVNSNNKSCG